MTEIFRGYFYNAKKNRSRSKAGTIAYFILFVGIMAGLSGGLFTYLSMSICGALTVVNMDWLFFALMGLLAVLLGVFGSVFNTYSCLYLAKDNDLMLSLPIPISVIMASRLLSVYLMGLMYSLVVIFPAVIVYWVTVSLSAGVIFGCLLLVLLISVFVLTLSCALGWVVAKISLKLKNKSFITVVVSLAFIGGYYFFYFKAQTLIQNLLANAAVYGKKIKGTAYPLYLFGRIGTGDAFAMAVVSAVILALFALMWALISRSFLKIATSSLYTSKKVYKERAMKQRGITAALLSKEFERFTSSPNYMLNCGLGILMHFEKPKYQVLTNFSPFKMDTEKHPWMGLDRYHTANKMLEEASDDFDVRDCFDILQAVSQEVCPTVVSMVFDVTEMTVYWCEDRQWDQIQKKHF